MTSSLDDLRDSLLGDGLLAFAGALWVLPRALIDTTDWATLTRGRIGALRPFALDVIGDVLALDGETVVQLDPDDAAVLALAPNLDAFAVGVRATPEAWVGAHWAARWTLRYGPIPGETRLLPRWPAGMRVPVRVEQLVALPWEDVIERRFARVARLPPGWKIQLE